MKASEELTEEQARQETNKGFRGGKGKDVDAKKGTGTSKAGSSNKGSEVVPIYAFLTSSPGVGQG